ncbi:LacI family DNA-binding transcriptional regulator [Edaphobacter sp. 12200R-103]|jgi:LacI family transcriptional regulator|uniref:LacI family DNA-binding transcriptional regulator n=1 Tax=Edaphobacter sp. 12200R-103 TaxID=2703788 RepID=UPI00138BBC98|nr:LacI family DNA-binding transcriptional regulator [Edaphobacter sp. 12200R-103]QHS51410.1 LacI family transcriptional regulator [Edaphobacter sp. 12200R-103]
MSRRKAGPSANKESTKSASRHVERRIDIRTVAASAKVSVATVSRVINNIANVDPALSKRVWEAISKLGYIPNNQARALVSGRSRLLGVIISDITNPFFPELIQGFEEEAVAAGYETLIGSTGYDLRRMEACVQRMLERKVDGVAVMTFGIEEPLLERFALKKIPMVFIDVAPEKKGFSAIHIDYDHGIHEAVQHLAVLGHRSIGFIAGPTGLHSAQAREQAFRSAVTSIGLDLPDEYVYVGDYTMEGGSKGAEHLLKLPGPPTAIVCSNDMTAIGAMHAVSRLGMKIPGDVSLIGFDDIGIARYVLPPLTTVRMSGREIATNAVRTLIASLKEEDSRKAAYEAVTTRLVVRQSTSIPKGSLAGLSKRRPARSKK